MIRTRSAARLRATATMAFGDGQGAFWPGDLAIHPGGRRRSDEICYWRGSYDPGFMSPLSSNAQDDVDDTGMLDISAPESLAVDRPPKTLPRALQLWSLSKEMMGMKITHAADMDMRLENLEFRALRMERVVEKLCHAVPDFQAPTDLKEPSRPSSSRRWLETDTKLKIPSLTSRPTPQAPSASPTARHLTAAFRLPPNLHLHHARCPEPPQPSTANQPGRRRDPAGRGHISAAKRPGRGSAPPAPPSRPRSRSFRTASTPSRRPCSP